MDTPVKKTIKTSILILSDTHTTPLQPLTSPHPFRHPLPQVDLLIHCGDLTTKGLLSEYEETLHLLSSIDAKVKLVIAGNHDRTLDKTWMDAHEGSVFNGEMQVGGKGVYEEARDFWFGDEGRAAKQHVRMLEEGLHVIDLENGAVLTLYTSQYQPEFCDWAFAYCKHQDRYNPPSLTLTDAQNTCKIPIPSFSTQDIDILCTHGPPYKRRDKTAFGHVGCPHLLRAVIRAKPLIHCFGHIHEAWGAERVSWSDKTENSNSSNSSSSSKLWKKQKKKAETIQQWKDHGWESHVKSVEEINCHGEHVMQRRAVFVDASEEGGRELKRGEQTLMLNAAIMDKDNNPVHAPFLIHLDLPIKGA